METFAKIANGAQVMDSIVKGMANKIFRMVRAKSSRTTSSARAEFYFAMSSVLI